MQSNRRGASCNGSFRAQQSAVSGTQDARSIPEGESKITCSVT